MVSLKLNKYWTQNLLRFPETGMGYQKVDIVLKSKEIIHDVTVFNAEDLRIPSQYSWVTLGDIIDIHIKYEK